MTAPALPPAPFQLEQLQGTLYTTTAAEPEPQHLVDNFRVPQELNQRLVLSSFPRGESQLEVGGWGGGPPTPPLKWLPEPWLGARLRC